MKGATLQLYYSDKGEGGCHRTIYFAGVIYDAGGVLFCVER